MFRWIIKGVKEETDIVVGACSFFVAYVLWKCAFYGCNEAGGAVMLFGMIDVSELFVPFRKMLLSEVSSIVGCFYPNLNVIEANYSFGVPGSRYSCVAWGCTCLKQCFILVAALLTARGNQLHKLWYIPLAILFMHLFNVVRIAVVGCILIEHPEQFRLFHDYIFRIGFYIYMGLIWYVWQLRHNPKW